LYQFHQYTSKLDINIEGAVLSIEILNVGEGIPLEIQPLLLNESVTDNSNLNFDGTGMGLSICMNFAKMLGGGIIFKSTPGFMKETIFILFVPLKPLENHIENTTKNENETGNGNQVNYYNQINFNKNKEEDTEAQNFTHKCNLIVCAEDNKSIMKFNERLLIKKDNINYLLFENGREAKNYLDFYFKREN